MFSRAREAEGVLRCSGEGRGETSLGLCFLWYSFFSEKVLGGAQPIFKRVLLARPCGCGCLQSSVSFIREGLLITCRYYFSFS